LDARKEEQLDGSKGYCAKLASKPRKEKGDLITLGGRNWVHRSNGKLPLTTRGPCTCEGGDSVQVDLVPMNQEAARLRPENNA